MNPETTMLLLRILYCLAAAFLFCFLLWFFETPAKAQDIVYKPAPLRSRAPDLQKLKRAILAVENTPWHIVGGAGERTSYQIMPETWSDWSFMPFAQISENSPEARKEVDYVVSKHLAWITKCLDKENYHVTPYSMALVYKAGLTRFRSYKCRFVDIEYAKRVCNVFEATK